MASQARFIERIAQDTSAVPGNPRKRKWDENNHTSIDSFARRITECKKIFKKRFGHSIEHDRTVNDKKKHKNWTRLFLTDDLPPEDLILVRQLAIDLRSVSLRDHRTEGGEKMNTNDMETAMRAACKLSPREEAQEAFATSALKTTGPENTTIGDYLILRLQDYGVHDVFGVPGDYILSFYDSLQKSSLNTIGCTREDCAGFAADAYARINGMGAICVTYCVGGLSVCNAIAGAFAEKSPVVVISGAPGLNERVNDRMLHHKVRDFDFQREVFQKLCVASSQLNDPETAFNEIDRVLDAAARYKRPVYLELPRDMVKEIPKNGGVHSQSELPCLTSDPATLEEATREAATMLSSAARPLILAGVEMHRFGLQEQLLQLAEQGSLPVAATILGKSVIGEDHPLYVGVYGGGMGKKKVTRFVEDSDCVLLLGTFMTDVNLGSFTAHLDSSRCIVATSEELKIGHHDYHHVSLSDFVKALIKKHPRTTSFRYIPPKLHDHRLPHFKINPCGKITISRLIDQLNNTLPHDTIIIADTGDAMFASVELMSHHQTNFFSPAYYTSMGFAVPAAIGAQVARKDQRVVALVGDGAFQMTGMELSTAVMHRLAPIILVLDNKGYGTERCFHPGPWKYNNILPWKYSQVPALLGGGTGYEVFTEDQFATALRNSLSDRKSFSLIQVHLSQDDFSKSLLRLARQIRKRI